MPRGLVAAVQDCSTNGLEAAGGHTVVLDAGWASIQAVAEPEAPALPSPPCQKHLATMISQNFSKIAFPKDPLQKDSEFICYPIALYIGKVKWECSKGL